MDDRTTQEEGELFDTTTPDDTTSANDTDVSETSEQEGEQELDGLDLPKEDKVKSSVTEANKLKQLDSWATKINSGEKSLEDLPVNLGWMKKDLVKLIDVKKEVAEVSVKDMVRQEIQNERDAAKFDLMKEDLNAILSADKKALVSESYKKYLKKFAERSGAAPTAKDMVDALESAMEINQIDLQKMGTEARHSRMKIPSPGRKGKPSMEEMGNRPWSEVVDTIPKAQRLEYLRNLAYNNRGN